MGVCWIGIYQKESVASVICCGICTHSGIAAGDRNWMLPCDDILLENLIGTRLWKRSSRGHAFVYAAERKSTELTGEQAERPECLPSVSCRNWLNVGAAVVDAKPSRRHCNSGFGDL